MNLNHAYLLKIVSFTIEQAALSTTLSLIGGWFIARIIFTQQWLWAEKWLLLPLMLPTLTITIGFMTIFLELGGIVPMGQSGIIICHCFFNLPLAALLIIKGYQHIPISTWQLSHIHRLPLSSMIIRVEIPLLKATMINASCLIFAYCCASFSIPLLIGGHPHTNTLTVALYYSLIVQGHTTHALLLIIIKIVISGGIFMLINHSWQKLATDQQLPQSSMHLPTRFPKLIVMAIVLITMILMLPPIIALIYNVIDDVCQVSWQMDYLVAISNSVGLALISAGIVVSVSVISMTVKPSWQQRLQRLSYIILLLPSFVLGYLIIKLSLVAGQPVPSTRLGLIIINCLISLPTTLKISYAAWQPIQSHYHYLIETLRLPLWPRITKIIWPLTAPALRLSLTLSLSYCLGDIGGILLFDQQQLITLPGLIYDASNRYDYVTARTLSIVLVALSITLFLFINHKRLTHVATD